MSVHDIEFKLEDAIADYLIQDVGLSEDVTVGFSDEELNQQKHVNVFAQSAEPFDRAVFSGNWVFEVAVKVVGLIEQTDRAEQQSRTAAVRDGLMKSDAASKIGVKQAGVTILKLWPSDLGQRIVDRSWINELTIGMAVVPQDA